MDPGESRIDDQGNNETLNTIALIKELDGDALNEMGLVWDGRPVENAQWDLALGTRELGLALGQETGDRRSDSDSKHDGRHTSANLWTGESFAVKLISTRQIYLKYADIFKYLI